jgi:sphingosine-1-phosphate phosphatase 1/sphingosine-1-phosphate phosphatase 2
MDHVVDHYPNRHLLKGTRLRLHLALLPYVEHGNEYVVECQKNKTAFKDVFFAAMSLIGAFDFYLVMFPLLFFLGFHRLSRDLLYLMAFGIYCGNVGKDFFCLKRPHKPRVQRKDTEEYGMPSTHTVNAVSLGLFTWLSLAWESSFTETQLLISAVVLGTIVCFVLHSRLYNGMHCVADIVGGFFIAVALVCSVKLGITKFLDHEVFDAHTTYFFPLGLFLAVLGLLVVHPRPVDPCPCFLDSVSFLAAFCGIWSGMWYFLHLRLDLGWKMEFLPYSFDKYGYGSSVIRVVVSLFFVVLARQVTKATFGALAPYILKLMPGLAVKGYPKRDHVAPVVPAEEPMIQESAKPESNGLHRRKEEQTEPHVNNAPTRALSDWPPKYTIVGLEKFVVYWSVAFHQTFTVPLFLYFVGHL